MKIDSGRMCLARQRLPIIYTTNKNMDTPQKTTEFSAHLSWATMRRHLHGRLSANESKQIEVHLQHCPRCSSAILDYIQTEEPEQYKQYLKKLKGTLKNSQTTKKRLLSSFQIKAIRTTASVIALLIFSFFAVKTVINKQGTDRTLPSESLASVKSVATPPPARRPAVRKPAQAPKATLTETAPSTKKKPQEKAAPQKPKQETSTPKKASVAPTKAPAQPKETVQPSTALVEITQPAPSTQAESATPTASGSTTAEATAPEREKQDAPDEPAAERVKAQPVPTLKKLDTKETVPAVAPLGSTRPQAIPVPGNQIRER